MDPAGQETSYTHDALGRETLRTYASPATPLGDDLRSIATTRDPNGNPLVVTETYSGATGTRVTERTWDDFDRLESEVDPEGQRLGYTYDANGNRLSLTDPDGQATRYAYDALNRVTAVTSAAGITEYAWLKDGRLGQPPPDAGWKSDVRTRVYSSPGFVLTVGWTGKIRVVRAAAVDATPQPLSAL